MINEDEMVLAEKCVLLRLDGISEIKFVQSECIESGGNIGWTNSDAVHIGETRNGYLIYKETKHYPEKLGLFN